MVPIPVIVIIKIMVLVSVPYNFEVIYFKSNAYLVISICQCYKLFFIINAYIFCCFLFSCVSL